MNTGVVTAVIGGLVVAGGVLIWCLVPRRQRLKRFESRPDLSLDQIYSDFFAQRNLPKNQVCELWREVAESLRLPPGKLRPTDRFDQELAPPKGWEHDDEILDVQWAAERRLKKTGIKADLSQVKTLADYVEFFCSPSAQQQRV